MATDQRSKHVLTPLQAEKEGAETADSHESGTAGWPRIRGLQKLYRSRLCVIAETPPYRPRTLQPRFEGNSRWAQPADHQQGLLTCIAIGRAACIHMCSIVDSSPSFPYGQSLWSRGMWL